MASRSASASLAFAQLNRREGDVLQNRHIREEVEVLEYHPDIFPNLVNVDFRVSNIVAVNVDMTTVRHLQPIQAA